MPGWVFGSPQTRGGVEEDLGVLAVTVGVGRVRQDGAVHQDRQGTLKQLGLHAVHGGQVPQKTWKQSEDVSVFEWHVNRKCIRSLWEE